MNPKKVSSESTVNDGNNQWKIVALSNRCSEVFSQNHWKIPMKNFTEMNFFTLFFQRFWLQTPPVTASEMTNLNSKLPNKLQ